MSERMTKQELQEFAVKIRLAGCGGAGPQSATLQAEAHDARAHAWLQRLDDVIALWAQEARDEPAEPIVWDGSREAKARILDIINHQGSRGGGANLDGSLWVTWRAASIQIRQGFSVQITGEAFVILPPEEVTE